MHLHTLERHMLELGYRLMNQRSLRQRNAELVATFARGDFRVGASIDIGIDPDRDWSDPSERPGYMVDADQLGLAFNVKRENTIFQSQSDFILRFAHAGKNAAL